MHTQQVISNNFKHYYYKLTEAIAKALELEEKKSEEEKIILEIQTPLLELINIQLKKIETEYEGLDRSYLKKGIYLQVALSDEIFLKKNWHGKKLWENAMLEHKIFNTQHAGDKVFSDINEILSDPFKNTKEIIALYLLILSLGFKGKLSEEKVKTYKQHLYAILYPSDDSIFKDDTLPLIPQNFNYTVSQTPKGSVPNIKTWGAICMGAVIIYTLITSVYWFNVQTDIKRVTNQLKERTKIGKSLR